MSRATPDQVVAAYEAAHARCGGSVTLAEFIEEAWNVAVYPFQPIDAEAAKQKSRFACGCLAITKALASGNVPLPAFTEDQKRVMHGYETLDESELAELLEDGRIQAASQRRNQFTWSPPDLTIESVRAFAEVTDHWGYDTITAEQLEDRLNDVVYDLRYEALEAGD